MIAYNAIRLIHVPINENDRITLYREVLNVPLKLELNSESPLFLSKNKNVYEILTRPMDIEIGAVVVSLIATVAGEVQSRIVCLRDAITADVCYRVALYRKALEMFAGDIDWSQIVTTLEQIVINPEKLGVELSKIGKMQQMAIVNVICKYVPDFRGE